MFEVVRLLALWDGEKAVHAGDLEGGGCAREFNLLLVVLYVIFFVELRV